MKIFITGGTGFVGRHVSQAFLEQGHSVIATGTRPDASVIDHPHFTYLATDMTQVGPWAEALQDCDIVINLAGRSIFNRWTKAYKQQIYDSRILTTRNLITHWPAKPGMILCSASAVGYYGDQGDTQLGEDAPAGKDFLARLAVDWEAEALRAEAKGARVVIMRFGIVLSPDGGALEKMLPPFKASMGGPLGNGQQWFPWIHIDDLKAALQYVIEQEAVSGPLNFCAPQPVRNRELAQTLGRVLHRPAIIPVPGFMLRVTMGEVASALLASQRVIPEHLQHHGFEFRFPGLETALRDLVGS